MSKKIGWWGLGLAVLFVPFVASPASCQSWGVSGCYDMFEGECLLCQSWGPDEPTPDWQVIYCCPEEGSEGTVMVIIEGGSEGWEDWPDCGIPN
jgi:hypothetical protein